MNTTTREQIREAGIAALQRLLATARRDTGQASVCARFLLGLYNDARFPFPLTELRRLDDDLFDDCMAALQLDARITEQEVHRYFQYGSEIWEQLASDWRVRDHTKPYRPR